MDGVDDVINSQPVLDDYGCLVNQRSHFLP